MGITSFGASGGKYDELFKSSLVPKESWKGNNWTTTDAYSYNGEIGLDIANPSTIISQVNANTNFTFDNSLRRAQTFTISNVSSYISHVSIRLANSEGNHTDIKVKIVETDSNNAPTDKVISEGVLLASTVPRDTTYRVYDIKLAKPIQLPNGVYAFTLETEGSSTYNISCSSTDQIAGGNAWYSAPTHAWSANSTYDFIFYLKGGSDRTTGGTVYTDIDMTKDIVQLDTFDFTKTTDGTNSITVDICDTNNNVIKGDIKSDTSLSDLELDTVRVKVTLAKNGSTNSPSLTYGLKQFVKSYSSNKTPATFNVYLNNATTIYPVCDITGSGTLVGITQFLRGAQSYFGFLKVTIDGNVIYDDESVRNLASYQESSYITFNYNFNFSKSLKVEAHTNSTNVYLTTAVNTLLD